MNEKIDHTCATCACLLMQTNPMNPLHKQGFCRLNPPKHARGVVEVPRMDLKTVTPVIGKDGKPVMEKQEQDFYLYEPTMPQLTCFRGWRPIGSEPGRHNIADDMEVLMDKMQPILNALGIYKAPLDS
jgi:hypothetical protein